MKILLVRHGIAQDSAPGGDRARRLTRDGREKFERGAAALAALVPDLALVVSSPLARARETAEILASACSSSPRRVEEELLAPEGKSAAVAKFLVSQKGLAAIALVGHEPNLSLLEGFLLTGQERAIGELKKGGAALIEFSTPVTSGRGVLQWHLTAGQLRDLAP